MIKSNPYLSTLVRHPIGTRFSTRGLTVANSMRSISRLLRARHFIGVPLLILMTCSIGFAAIQQNSIAGHWEGAIKLPSGDLRLSVDFTNTAGKLSATV